MRRLINFELRGVIAIGFVQQVVNDFPIRQKRAFDAIINTASYVLEIYLEPIFLPSGVPSSNGPASAVVCVGSLFSVLH